MPIREPLVNQVYLTHWIRSHGPVLCAFQSQPQPQGDAQVNLNIFKQILAILAARKVVSRIP